jgi:tetratricopeptide (TPR) repeat protein
MTSLPCPPQHWTRFSALLDAAMDLPEPARDGWLRRLQGQDATLRPWLERVLHSAASISTGDFMQGPRLAEAPGEDFAAGDMLGPYRLLALLGEGGMGRVWRAVRADDGPHREVALKLPHAELLGGPFRQRFRRERDVLAALSHPHIAALYDAGVSAEGHPYMALELVSGSPITKYCVQQTAPLERIVDLVRQVLQALSYAHSRLIVHRDIKPSNVMVTADGQVKLLDFGIAKLLHVPGTGDASGEAPLTQAAGRLATPGYAPPEQMDGGAITVSADLFAAGVLLFELCTGQRPSRLYAGGAEAPLASSRATKSPKRAAASRQLRGDLDAIIARALAIDPARRYGSADAFERDLRRWRDGLPVSARRAGWAARAGKFVRRNRAGVALAAVLGVALAGGTAGIAWQARRAEREAARANAVKDFLISLFEQVDPRNGGKPSDTMTAKELLEHGADRVDAAFASQPATEIEVLETLGNMFALMEDQDRTQRIWQRRLDLARATNGPADPATIDSALNLANDYIYFQQEDKARALLDSIRPIVMTKYGDHSLERARWMVGRASSLRITHGARDEAIADERNAIAILEQYYPTDPAYPDALNDLVGYLYDAEDYAGSLATLNKMRDVERAAHQYDPVEEMQYWIQSASRLERMRRFDEADAAYAKGADQAAKLIGRTSLWYLYAVSGRASLHSLLGDGTAADEMLAPLLGSVHGVVSATGSSTSARRVYGSVLAREGRAAEAVPVLEQVLAETRLHNHDESNMRRTEGYLGDAYDQVGRTAQARVLLRAARDEWMREGPSRGQQALGAGVRWARFLLDHGDVAAAGIEYERVLDLARHQNLPAFAAAEAGLATLALRRGDVAAADDHSRQAVARLAATTLEYDVRLTADVWLVRSQVLAATGRTMDAKDFAGRALKIAQRADAATSPLVARAQLLRIP